jgi:hypothetical protein
MAAALLLALLLQFREGREPFGGLHSTRKKQHVPREQDAPFQLAVARRLNAALLDVTASREVHSLRGALAATSVRYIGVVETRPASSKVHALDGVHFVARMTGTRETAGHAVIAEKYRTVSFRPGETTFTLIGTDEATGANGDIAYGPRARRRARDCGVVQPHASRCAHPPEGRAAEQRSRWPHVPRPRPAARPTDRPPARTPARPPPAPQATAST